MRVPLLLKTVLAIPLLVASPPSAGQQDREGPTYIERLSMPHRRDGFSQPRAVVADLHANEIFVCDTFNNRIVIFDAEGVFRYQIPGGGIFRIPKDLAVDAEGHLYVADAMAGSRGILLLDFDGRSLGRVSLSGLPSGIEVPQITSLALSGDDRRLVVLDENNHRLWITEPSGQLRASVDLAAGRSAEEVRQLRYGHVDVYGETVLLALPTDGLVYTFDLDGRAIGSVGQRGTAYCQTMFPKAAAIDDQGRVIILDLQRAMFMTWDPEAGRCLAEHYGFGNVPGAMYQPNDLALDGAGRVYVAQGLEGRVQVYAGARPAARADPTR